MSKSSAIASVIFLSFSLISICKGQCFTGCNYEGTLYRHPANCNRFMQCSNGYEWILTCPMGLVFNDIIQACDYVENVPECTSMFSKYS